MEPNHHLIEKENHPLGIQSPSENGNGTYLNTLRYGGDCTPQSSSDSMTGSLGIFHPPPF